ncbi:MAG: hypothetical protein ABIJ56_13665 [Pseudomonadota bacterium]
MKKSPLISIVPAAAALVLLASCAAGPETAPPAQEPAPPAPEPVDTAQDEEAAQLEKNEESMRAAVARLNEAVKQEDVKLLAEAVSKQTFELMIERARKEAVYKGIGKEPVAADVIADLHRWKVVFSLATLNTTMKTALLWAWAGSWLYLKADIVFVEEDGRTVLDISTWYGKTVADYDKVIKEREEKEAVMKPAAGKLVADLNKALDEADAGLLAAALSPRTLELAVELLGLLPKKQGGKDEPTPEKLAALLSSKIDRIELKSLDTYSSNVVLAIHPHVPSKAKAGQQPAQPFDQYMLLAPSGKEGGFVLDCSAWLEKENARIEDENAVLAKVKWALYRSKDKDESCQQAFENGFRGKAVPGKSGTPWFPVPITSEEEFKAAFPSCTSGINWKKHRLVRASVEELINTHSFGINGVRKKGNKIIVTVTGQSYCAGPPLPVNWAAWVLIPAGEEAVTVDTDIKSDMKPCLAP